MLGQHRAPIRVQLRAVLVERASQGGPALRIVRLFAGKVFAELNPALQHGHRITRLCGDWRIGRKQGDGYSDP